MTASDEEIHTLMEGRAKAVRAREIGRITSDYAPEVLIFDVVDPLQTIGSDAVSIRSEEWLSSFHGPIGFEMRELTISASATVAFCHSLNRVHGTKSGGGELDMWWRATLGFRKIEGEWKITHEHNSVPFNAETGKASLGLKPSLLLRSKTNVPKHQTPFQLRATRHQR